MAAMQLTRTHRILIGVVVAGAVVIAGIGFAGSYAAVRALALQKGFGSFSLVFPIGIDAGICVLLALDLLLTWIRIPFPLLRQTAWLLTAATIAFNGAAAWPDPLGVGMHAVIPILFVVTVEAARHAVGRIADITADRHMEGVRITRWLLSPVPTFKLWRRMKLWELRSYEQAVGMEQDRLIYQARLQARYGRAWRRKAPVEALMPLRLARIGVPLSQTAPEGLAAAGIDPVLLPPVKPVPPALAGRDETLVLAGRDQDPAAAAALAGQDQATARQLAGQVAGQANDQAPSPLTGQPNGPGQVAGQAAGQIPGQINGQTTGHLAGAANGLIPGQPDAQGRGQANGQLAGQFPGQINGQANGQFAGQANGQANGQADGQVPGQAGGPLAGQANGQFQAQAAGQLSGQFPGQGNNQGQGPVNGPFPGQSAGQANGQNAGQANGHLPPAFAVDPTAMPAAHNSAWFAAPLAPQASYEGGYNPGEPAPEAEGPQQEELPEPPAAAADADAPATADDDDSGFDQVKFNEAAYEVFRSYLDEHSDFPTPEQVDIHLADRHGIEHPRSSSMIRKLMPGLKMRYQRELESEHIA
ncbi:DUF2637 domain-containing protein [Streptomyces sp. NBC_01565]|uniref:DUF2637 domain-containing protein n=1 Tax=Streptomyces sp. NBC_01565 TaxID=2975881 RepID=UPI00224F9093|nr:DUF2637 domain-containing protein [Streptomyces sp. NBC_01565]MCX4542041.1 DUF2637 domain-containing protein [Streptomyces sp. NBC_01565]